MEYDYTYLSNNYKFSMDSTITGVNNNEIIYGGTGAGKTLSVVEPKLVHAKNMNYIITVNKRKIVDKYKKNLKLREYKVYDLDLSNIKKSDCGIDFFSFIKTDRDIIHLATTIIKNHKNEIAKDPYWEEAAISVLAAEIALLRKKNNNLTMYDLIKFHNTIILNEKHSLVSTNVDYLFKEAELEAPGCLASRGWSQLKSNPIKTASCIFSTLNNCLDKIFTEDILELSKQPNLFSLYNFTQEKSILFITTSPVDTTLQNYINVLYSLFFKELFNLAEKSKNYQLRYPIHFVCDDFACGGIIPNFEQYISVFRACGISVSLLLQSETQLYSLYGEYAASTIINNCDTILYMSGSDIKTWRNMSVRANIPIEDIISMPLDNIILYRRGMEPIFDKRYQILNDLDYIPIEKEYKSFIA